MYSRYKVIVDLFSETHHLKKLRKRYKSQFDIPWSAFLIMLERIELLLGKNRNNVISDSGSVAICKIDFKISKNESAKGSGNRCIVAWHKEEKLVRVLFVYGKQEVRKNMSETVWWKQAVRKQFPEYRNLL